MKHNSCGRDLTLDLSNMYTLVSPAISISSKGIFPGMVQVEAVNAKKTGVVLHCIHCEESLSTKEAFDNNVRQPCDICGKDKKPSEIYVTDYISCVCDDCIEASKNSESLAKMAMRDVKYRYLAMYAEKFASREFPTLLTILMKKF